ncbi:MAG: heavy metal translocating P-type ATPase [Desulfobacterales bacterium]|nr:heavy metal translocating P-type ATPase [Desulfobacterales bacterium]
MQCEVRHSIDGRIRLDVPTVAKQSELIDGLKKYLWSKEGIKDVICSNRKGQFTIYYDTKKTNKNYFLSKIKDLSVELLHKLKHELPEIEPKDTSSFSLDSQFMDSKICYIVQHAVLGRIRITFPSLTFYKDLLHSAKSYLLSKSGVKEVDLNQYCGSLAIKYDIEVVKEDEIFKYLSEMTFRDLINIKSEMAKLPVEEQNISRKYLMTTSVALGLAVAFIGLPVMALPIVYPILIMVCIPVYKRAYRCVKNERRLNVDFLDASALTTSMLTFDPINAAAMCWLIHLGDYIRDLTAASSQRTIRKLLDFQDNYVWVVHGDVEVKVKVREIVEGDVVVLNVGNIIPVDGKIVKGELIVDQKVLTGESMPIHKEVGDMVFASTIVCDGKAYVETSRTGDHTKVAQVVKMVEEAPLYETRIQNHAEKVADRIVAPSLITTSLIFASTLNIGQLAALLTVDFGTGIRVSAPTAVLSSMIATVSHGILIKGGSYLEKLCNVDTIVFDKTGTLTTGVIKVEDIVSFNGYNEQSVLSYAASAEIQMTHPIAEAIISHANEEDVPLQQRDSVKYWVGRGVEAFISGKRVMVGSKRLLNEQGISTDEYCDSLTDRFINEGKACLYISVDNDLCGIIAFRDQIRKEAKEMIRSLHEVGVKQVIMLTGDVKKLAIPVANTLGIDRCISDVLPEEKAQVIIDLKKEGRLVAFVGDGINDSVALSYADIGISVRGGADITKETAGVILLDDDLLKIPKAFQISRSTIRLIKENYSITAGFNIVAYALAAIGLLSPVTSTLISNGSAVVACINGMKPIIKLKMDSFWTKKISINKLE